MTPVELFIQIVKDGGAGVVCTSMVDDDMRAFYQQPWVMVASDGGIGVRHPRGAGTFPRVLGKYVRDERWLTLPEAIRKMTSAPADRLKLADRGRIVAGAIADLVMFNPKTVVDRSTFSDPGILPTGIEKVFVGGELVWDGGKAGGRAAGEGPDGDAGDRTQVRKLSDDRNHTHADWCILLSRIFGHILVVCIRNDAFMRLKHEVALSGCSLATSTDQEAIWNASMCSVWRIRCFGITGCR